MKKDLNYLICNLIGATEILEVAYLKGDMKSTMQALKRIETLRNELWRCKRRIWKVFLLIWKI